MLNGFGFTSDWSNGGAVFFLVNGVEYSNGGNQSLCDNQMKATLSTITVNNNRHEKIEFKGNTGAKSVTPV